MVARQIANIVVALAFVLAPLTLSAQDASTLSDEERAELGRLFTEARESYDAEQFERSIQKLMAAYEIFPEPNILYRIGEMHETLENRAMAAEFYERYLAENPDDGDRALIESRIERLRKPRVTESTVPSRLTIVTKPGDAEVYLIRGDENERLGTSPIELELEPGSHTVRIEKDGFEGLTRRFEIGAGELRTAELSLEEIRPSTPIQPPQTSVAPWIFSFASFATVGASVAFFVLANQRQSQLDEWDAERTDMMRPLEYDDVLDEELTFRVVAWSFVGVSAALATTAVVWWLTDDQDSYSLNLGPGSVHLIARFE